MTKTFRFIGMVLMAVLVSVSFAACSDDDEEGEYDDSSSSGSVTVTATKGTKKNAHYVYKIKVKYSGSDAKSCGVYYGKTSGMDKTKTHSGSGTHTFSCDFYTGSRYYYQGFVKTTSGKTLTSKKKNVYVNK